MGIEDMTVPPPHSVAAQAGKAVIQRNLLAHLAELVRARDPFFATQGRFYVQKYLSRQLSQWSAVIPQAFDHNGQQSMNWSIHLPGQVSRQLAPIVVGAHYDAVPGTPGADDNATGLAVLLELARLWHDAPGRRPLWLVAFDQEEYGLKGSQVYVQHFRHCQQSIHLMLSLEMLGYCDPTPGAQRYPAGLARLYPNTGDFIALIGNWQRIPTLMRLKSALKTAGTPCQWMPMLAAGRPLPLVRRSDHASFWDAGYDAVLVTDTADLRNPHYHKASDTLETLDLDFLTGVCAGLYTGLRLL